MLDGFKKFIMRGNVIDLAVGVIIGNAFKPIIDALTDKILLRLISAIFGKPSFNEVGTFHIGTTPIEPGVLITAVVNFLIVAAALYFCIVMPMNRLAERRSPARPIPRRLPRTKSSSSRRSGTPSPTTARGVSASRASASHVGREADSRPTSMSAPPGSNATFGAIRQRRLASACDTASGVVGRPPPWRLAPAAECPRRARALRKTC